MNFKLEQEFSKTDIIKQVDDLKSQIDAMRPLPPDVEGKVMQKLRLDWNYHSNAIEGNRLSYGETTALLMHGITAKGKPLKDHLDIQGHNEAIDYLLAIVRDGRRITETDIRSLHTIILVEPYRVKGETSDGLVSSKQIALGEYKKMPNHVKTITDEIHYYATPEETPAKMQELMEWYNTAVIQKDIHPLVIAALFHHQFVSIHPFDDGNGRLARILMNLILMQSNYPPVVIKSDKEDRHSYYALLSQADVGENWPFVEHIAELMANSLSLYLKAAHGGDIEEDDDIDKEVALFRLQIKNQVTVKKVRDFNVIKEVLNNEIEIFINKLTKTIQPFSNDFIGSSRSLILKFDQQILNASVTSVNNNDAIERIRKSFNVWKGIDINFTFSKFKNNENDFSISFGIKVQFEYYEYKIYGINNQVVVSKLYHENLSNNDQKIILKNIIENIKAQIQSSLDD